MTSGSPEGDGAHNFSGAVPALGLLTTIFFLTFTARVSFSPLLPVVSEELGLSNTGAGSFFLLISLGYFVAILLAGFVSFRIQHKPTIVVSTLATGVVLLFLANCESSWALRVCLVALGAAAGLYLPSGLTTLAGLVPRSYLGRGMAVHEIAPNLSFVLTPLLCALTLEYLSWRYGLAILGAVTCFVAVCFWVLGPVSRERPQLPRFSVFVQLMQQRNFWLLTIMFSMAICSTLGVYAMLPLFLVNDRAMEIEQANTLVSASRIISVFMPLFSGWLGDKIGDKPVMGLVLLLAGLFTIPIGFTDGWVLVLMVVVQPMIAVCFFPSGFSALSKRVSTTDSSTTISFSIPLAFLCGGGMLPAVIGMIGDFTHLGHGIVVVGIFMALASACVLVMKED